MTFLQQDMHPCAKCGARHPVVFSPARYVGPFKAICLRCGTLGAISTTSRSKAAELWNWVN